MLGTICVYRWLRREFNAALFAACIDAKNCAMMVGMVAGYESNDTLNGTPSTKCREYVAKVRMLPRPSTLADHKNFWQN